MSTNYAVTGPILRTFPKMRVLRGYDPTRPSTLQKSAPVQSGVTVFSGQVISLYWSAALTRFEWILGYYNNVASTAPVYFANGDSVDPDIISADSLPALPCFGQYVLQTGYYDAGTYNAGTPLTPSLVNAGNVVATTIGAATSPIIGYADGVNGSSNTAIVNLGAPTTDAGYAAYAPYDSSATNLSVLQLVTAFVPGN